jgi:hypothetical protein
MFEGQMFINEVAKKFEGRDHHFCSGYFHLPIDSTQIIQQMNARQLGPVPAWL